MCYTDEKNKNVSDPFDQEGSELVLRALLEQVHSNFIAVDT